MSRTGSSIKNFIWSNASTLVSTVLNFVLRTILIKTLGSTYVGVNSLFTNVLGMLSLADLGIGTAISFSLYKPLAENDISKIQALINFYRKAYRIVAMVVFAIGIVLIPFLPKIAKGSEGVEHLTIIYCIYIFNTVTSYLITYKSTIISADQKAYLITNINMVVNIIIIVFQIIVLLVWKNYIAYLITASIIGLIRNIYINLYTGKKYPYLKHRNAQKLSKEDKSTIFEKIKALLCHRIGQVVISQTDSIITSSIINVTMVGYVANYNMLINVIKTITSSFFDAMIPSIGNLIVTSDKEYQIKTYKNIEFLAFWINSFTAICLYFLMTPFIRIWIGDEYVLNYSVIFLLVINYYIYISRLPINAMRNASGVFEPDRMSPIIESIINLIVSVVFAKLIGVEGIFIGTLVSSFIPAVWCPIVVHKYVFKIPAKSYFVRQALRLCILLAAFGLLSVIFKYIYFENLFANLILRGIVCVAVSNALVVLCYFKTAEFKNAISLGKGLVKKLLKK